MSFCTISSTSAPGNAIVTMTKGNIFLLDMPIVEVDPQRYFSLGKVLNVQVLALVVTLLSSQLA